MTVRAWFTISALVLAGLAAAFGFRLFLPLAAPEIRVHAGDVRLSGTLAAQCWAKRSGGLRCQDPKEQLPTPRVVPDSGKFRLVVTYPAQPKKGFVRITRVGDGTVLRTSWTRTLPYRLDPGEYVLTAQAGERPGAFVRYVFAFRVTRSGS